MPAAVEFQAVTRTFGRTKALDDVTLTVEPGTFTVLCGPPRSGKSTLFRVLVGLDRPDGGRILSDGRDITALPPGQRNFGYVPQSFALYPHLTVFENIAYPLRLARVPSSEVVSRVDRATAMLSIGHLVKNTPDQLSGGEKQRVAVARGLLTNASVFVLDDPLVGLDYKLRERLMDDLKLLSEELKATFVYATADSLEALTMAQTLVVMDDGRVVEKGDVLDIYREPRFARTAELIGFPRANVWRGEVRGGVIRTDRLSFAAPAGTPDGPVVLGVRPEDILLDRSAELVVRSTVSILEHLGSEIVVYLDSGDGDLVTCAFASSQDEPPKIDQPVAFGINPERIMVFDAKSGKRLGRGRAQAGGNADG